MIYKKSLLLVISVFYLGSICSSKLCGASVQRTVNIELQELQKQYLAYKEIGTQFYSKALLFNILSRHRKDVFHEVAHKSAYLGYIFLILAHQSKMRVNELMPSYIN
jgi:hypothetical protein